MIIIRKQKELAEYIGVTSGFITEINRGEKRLGKDKQEKLKEFYRMKMKEMRRFIDNGKEWRH